jgi:hypothetical protein
LFVAQLKAKKAPQNQRFKNPSEIARERRALPKPDELKRGRPQPDDTLPRVLGLDGWKLPKVLAARNDQARGVFAQPARLMRSARTDACVFAAILNRIAPQMCLPMTIEGGPAEGHAAREGGLRDRALAEARAQFLGDESALPPSVRAEINECLAAHGVAFAQNIWTPREGGRRVDVRIEMWPIEFVRHFEIGHDGGRGFYALTYEGQWVPIVHGDGQWLIFAGRELEPWISGALMPSAQKWADRAFAERDRAQNARSHGDSKWIGTMPSGIKIKSNQGLTMLHEMEQLNEFERVMLKPYGSELVRSEAISQNWQIFKEIITQDNSDIFMIWLGQEPRGDSSQRLSIEQLFGVSQDVVGSDLSIMERTINTGTVRSWQARNYGRTDLVRGVKWLMPDPEEDARRKSIADRWTSFYASIKAARESGLRVDQSFITSRAHELGLVAPAVDVIGLTRADISEIDIKYGIVTLNEVRATMGLAPIAGGDVTVPQTAQVEKVATSPAIPPGSTPAPGGGQPTNGTAN